MRVVVFCRCYLYDIVLRISDINGFIMCSVEQLSLIFGNLALVEKVNSEPA